MTAQPDYSTARLAVMTLRDAVVRRPAMYFGDYPTADWPLVIAAWTVLDLIDYATGSPTQVQVVLNRGGDLSAAVAGGRVATPVTGPVDVGGRAGTPADVVAPAVPVDDGHRPA